jgi:hypothetical protein
MRPHLRLKKTEDNLYIVNNLSELELVKDETFVFVICSKCNVGRTSLVVNAKKILENNCFDCNGETVNFENIISDKISIQELQQETIFMRGDKVDFAGNDKYKSVKGTYVWAVNPHLCIEYVIEHPDGLDKSHFMATMGCDGFESIPSKELQKGLKYIYVEPNEIKKV